MARRGTMPSVRLSAPDVRAYLDFHTRVGASVAVACGGRIVFDVTLGPPPRLHRPHSWRRRGVRSLQGLPEAATLEAMARRRTSRPDCRLVLAVPVGIEQRLRHAVLGVTERHLQATTGRHLADFEAIEGVYRITPTGTSVLVERGTLAGGRGVRRIDVEILLDPIVAAARASR